jgi:hypothetical protein
MDLPGDWFVVTFLTCAKAGAAVTHNVSTAAQQSVAQTKFIQASLSANIFSVASTAPDHVCYPGAWPLSLKKSFGCGDKF